MRRAAKIDANQVDIVTALRKAGATVQSLAAIGAGCPDLLVGYKGVNYLMEVKDGSKPPSGRKLTPDQVEWLGKWKGAAVTITTIDGAIEVINEKSN